MVESKKVYFRHGIQETIGIHGKSKGIGVDPDKIKVIMEMKPPRTEKEIQGFLGRIQYISRFIA